MTSIPPGAEEQKTCRECGAMIPKSARVCPKCGIRQLDGPTPPQASSRSFLGGCVGIAVLAFLAVFVVGIIAAIAIPKFANTKEKAHAAAMKADLRNLVTAEEAYFQDSVKYTTDVSRLNFHSTPGVSTPAIAVGPGYWRATVTSVRLPGHVCGIAVNTSNTLVPTAGDGEPACR